MTWWQAGMGGTPFNPLSDIRRGTRSGAGDDMLLHLLLREASSPSRRARRHFEAGRQLAASAHHLGAHREPQRV